MTVTPELLAEWERLAEAATAGPWNDRRVGSVGNGLPRSHEEQLCNADGVGVLIVQHDGNEDGDANIALCAAARTAVPALCAAVRLLEASLQTAAMDAARTDSLAHGYTDDIAQLQDEVASLRAALVAAQDAMRILADRVREDLDPSPPVKP